MNIFIQQNIVWIIWLLLLEIFAVRTFYPSSSWWFHTKHDVWHKVCLFLVRLMYNTTLHMIRIGNKSCFYMIKLFIRLKKRSFRNGLLFYMFLFGVHNNNRWGSHQEKTESHPRLVYYILQKSIHVRNDKRGRKNSTKTNRGVYKSRVAWKLWMNDLNVHRINNKWVLLMIMYQSIIFVYKSFGRGMIYYDMSDVESESMRYFYEW